MSADYIFVYGSLRSEFTSPVHSVLKEYAEFTGKAVCKGEMYIIDWYPGVVETDSLDDLVAGEVYKIHNEEIVLPTLDQYEGCSPGDSKPHEFVRKEKKVQLTNGEEILVWIYIYVMSTSGKERINSGDYTQYKKIQKRGSNIG